MKQAAARWRDSFGRAAFEREVEEELRFHLEMRTQECLKLGMTPEQASAEALRRFGDVAKIKSDCLKIGNRNRPVVRALKVSLIAAFVGGMVLHITAADIFIRHVGDVLILNAVLGRALLHVRQSLRSARFRTEAAAGATLLPDAARHPTVIPAYDEQGRTPVERAMSDSP